MGANKYEVIQHLTTGCPIFIVRFIYASYNSGLGKDYGTSQIYIYIKGGPKKYINS